MPQDRDPDAAIECYGADALSAAAKDYLLAEFDSAWRHLGGLEDKRLRLFIGYCVFATLNLLGALALLVHAGTAPDSLSGGWQVRLLPAIWLLLISLAFRQVSISERKATERYRNKINLLRRTLLDGLKSERLASMQREGNDNALQIQPNLGKDLRAMDLFDKRRWTTALFMKLVYDLGAVVALVMCAGMVISIGR